MNNGASILDVSAKPPATTTAEKLPKNKRRRQRRDTLPTSKPVQIELFFVLFELHARLSRFQVTTSELTNQLLQSDYFLDINPRILQRLINIIAMTGRLLRANQVLFSWKRLGCWSYLVEQWPYRISWIVVCHEDHEQDYSGDTPLKCLYEKYVSIDPWVLIFSVSLEELNPLFQHRMILC